MKWKECKLELRRIIFQTEEESERNIHDEVKFLLAANLASFINEHWGLESD